MLEYIDIHLYTNLLEYSVSKSVLRMETINSIWWPLFIQMPREQTKLLLWVICKLSLDLGNRAFVVYVMYVLLFTKREFSQLLVCYTSNADRGENGTLKSSSWLQFFWLFLSRFYCNLHGNWQKKPSDLIYWEKYCADSPVTALVSFKGVHFIVLLCTYIV